MSGKYYDISGKATCKKCKSDMILSIDRNFNGPKCRNPKCDGGISDADYDSKKIEILNSYNTFLENYYATEQGTIQNTDVQS